MYGFLRCLERASGQSALINFATVVMLNVLSITEPYVLEITYSIVNTHFSRLWWGISVIIRASVMYRATDILCPTAPMLTFP